MGERRTDVIIIGAGLAGLSAALELDRLGISCVVLEARNRVGGRVFSEQVDGLVLDHGAQWVSSRHKRMLELVREFGLTTVPTYKQGETLYKLAGRQYRGASDKLDLPTGVKLDLYRMLRIMEELVSRVDPVRPWSSRLAERLDIQTMAMWLEQRMWTKVGRAFYRVMMEEGLCAEAGEFSVLDLMWMAAAAGGLRQIYQAEEFCLLEGAQELPVRMARRLGQRICLGTAVRSVRWGAQHVEVLTDGGSWEGKRVIVAIPPVFAGRINYEPALPPLRDQLSQRVAQGAVIKWNIVYKEPFWRHTGLSGRAYEDGGLVKTTMDSSVHSGGGHGMLIALSAGRGARVLSEMESGDREQALLQSLGRLFGDQALEPLLIKGMDWSADPWSRGGYGAYMAPGVLTQVGPALMKPIGPLYWAGTETATEWRLYMEGAVQSGQRAAEEVRRSLSGVQW